MGRRTRRMALRSQGSRFRFRSPQPSGTGRVIGSVSGRRGERDRHRNAYLSLVSDEVNFRLARLGWRRGRDLDFWRFLGPLDQNVDERFLKATETGQVTWACVIPVCRNRSRRTCSSCTTGGSSGAVGVGGVGALMKTIL